MFWFIVKEDHPQTYHQFMGSFPTYADATFEVSMKLWREVDKEKDERTIIKICQNYGEKPEYIVEYLQKFKKISEVMADLPQEEREYRQRHSYDSKMN